MARLQLAGNRILELRRRVRVQEPIERQDDSFPQFTAFNSKGSWTLVTTPRCGNSCQIVQFLA